MPIRVEVRGITELRARLGDLKVELEDWTDLWDRFGAIMADTEEEWFASGGEGSWPPLSNYTTRYKLRRGFPLDPLIRTGQLSESLFDPAQAMEIGQGRSTIGTFTRKSMSWGTGVRDPRGKEYAHYHQHWDPITGQPVDYDHNPPERKPIPWPLPAQTVAAMDRAEEEWVAEMIAKSGLS